MKKYFLLLTVALLCHTGCAGTFRITNWRSYPGARVKGECQTYAAHVVFDLERKGLQAHQVRYEWNSKRGAGRHAVVLFRYSGDWFIVDNEKTDPCPVTRFAGKETGSWTPKSMLRAVQHFDRNATAVYFVD